MRTFPVNLRRDPALPTGIHDPRWKEPATGALVAFNEYQRLLSQPELFADVPLRASTELGQLKGASVDKRTFPLVEHELPARKLRFKGGSYGEIHRRYSFGGRLPAVNFHAQVVCFGIDSEGRYVLKATVGRMDGGWGNTAALVVRFVDGEREPGGTEWSGALDPPGDKQVLVTGRDARLIGAFDGIRDALVGWHTLHAPK